MTNQETLKQQAAVKAIEFVKPDMLVGVGTGSTTNYFIDALASVKGQIEGCVASSNASTERLKGHGIPVFELTTVNRVDLYVDGADEFTQHKQLIKGGGGALTREKIVAAEAKQFICIVDQTKQVDVLGAFPLPIEVIPMARSYVARQLVKLGGSPDYREGFVTDNGNIILDVFNLSILEPSKLEAAINNIVGVVSNGLFAMRGADKVIIAGDAGITVLD